VIKLIKFLINFVFIPLTICILDFAILGIKINELNALQFMFSYYLCVCLLMFFTENGFVGVKIIIIEDKKNE
jgi:hypothetical protein